MGPNYLFRSERLGFRNWTADDVPKMTAINADPGVMQFFPAPATPQQTLKFVERMQDEYRTRGYCYSAVDVLETGDFRGFIGLLYQDYKAEFPPCKDIGWRLSKKAWNKGYATEGAKRCLDYAFSELQLKEVLAVATKTTNLQ